MECHSRILPIFLFMIFIYFLSFFLFHLGWGRGVRIRFSQNGKVEQVSFQYAWGKQNLGRIEDLPFLDFSQISQVSQISQFLFVTTLHANTMPIKAWQKTALL